jgi:hypothetical protein
MMKDPQLMRESGMTTNGIATKGMESASGSGSQIHRVFEMREGG